MPTINMTETGRNYAEKDWNDSERTAGDIWICDTAGYLQVAARGSDKLLIIW